MSSAPWSQNYITFTYKTKKCMPISVQRTSWTPLLKTFKIAVFDPLKSDKCDFTLNF